MGAEVIVETLKTYGPWGLVLAVLIYILLKGQFTFRYPRHEKRQKN